MSNQYVKKIHDYYVKDEEARQSISNHASSTENPHGVTKSQIGLGNVPNKKTNDQTPTFSVASTLATLVSGEKLSVSMGKIMKAITDLINHLSNTENPHSVTQSQIGLEKVNNTADSEKSVKYATSAGKATKDASGNTIASYYAPNQSLVETNEVVSALQTSLSQLGNNVSTNANAIGDIRTRLASNRLSLVWTGSQLDAYIDGTKIGKITIS